MAVRRRGQGNTEIDLEEAGGLGSINLPCPCGCREAEYHPIFDIWLLSSDFLFPCHGNVNDCLGNQFIANLFL